MVSIRDLARSASARRHNLTDHPRSISAMKDRPEFRRDFSRFAVYLDGALVRDWIHADAINGFVVTTVDDGKGGLVTNGADARVEQRRGAVAIQRTSLPLTERYSEAFLRVFGNDRLLVVAQ